MQIGNKAFSWENFLKKNKKNSMLIRDFRKKNHEKFERIFFEFFEKIFV